MNTSVQSSITESQLSRYILMFPRFMIVYGTDHFRQKLETVTSFKCLVSVTTDEGSKPEILPRIAQTTVALTRLKPVWNDRSISLSSKIWLMRYLVTSIFLYTCESWTLTALLQREYKPWKWGATTRYCTSHTKTMLPMRKSMPRSSRQFDHTKISWWS